MTSEIVQQKSEAKNSDLSIIDYRSFNSPILFPGKEILVFNNLMNPYYQEQLRGAFGFLEFKMRDSDTEKPNRPMRYSVNVATEESVNSLSKHKITAWEKFSEEVCSTQYKHKLSELLSVNICNKKTKIEFVRYNYGDFVGTHHDREPEKIVTQLFYLNQHWDSSWGCHFDVLDSHDPSIVAASIPPLAQYSILLQCTDQAWHGVPNNVGPHPRDAIVVQYFEQ